MKDLDALIAAVEAGAAGEDVLALARAIPRLQYDIGRRDDADDVRRAHAAKDLNAALRLHEALLPGWVVENLGNAVVDGTGGWNVRLVAPDYLETFKHSTANSATPARSWLLAVLRALREKGQ